MSSARILRFEIPGADVLRRLVREPLPLGLQASAAEQSFFRDRFWDTPGGDLARRGALVRIRLRPDGTGSFRVEVRDGDAPESAGGRQVAEAEVTDPVPEELFVGGSEPARLLRAMIDPERLFPQLELETTRWTRTVDPSEAEAGLTLIFDAVTLRRGDLATDLWNLELVLPEPEPTGLDRIVSELERDYGLRMTLAEPLRGAQERLDALETSALERAIRAGREVAVLARSDGQIALHEADGGASLRILGGQGAGEEAVRRVLRASFGAAHGRIRLLSSNPAAGARPAIEVWLAEELGAPESASDEEGRSIVWLPITELLDRVGAPQLRDVRTLAALHAATRAGLGSAAATAQSGGAALPSVLPVPAPRTVESAPPPLETIAKQGGLRKAAAGLPDTFLLNMELSTLAFNARVLALAEDPRIPLLERVRFLSIFGSNLDEFFMDRVGGFKRQIASGSHKPSMDGLSPEEQLDVIGIRGRALFERAYNLLHDSLLPALAAEDIRILGWAELEENDRTYLESFYASEIDAVLTPLAADPSHPFPHVRNLRPALAAIIRVSGSNREHFAAIELPGDLPRFVPLSGGRRFVPLEEVIRAGLPRLYSGMDIVEAHTFRVTRAATISLDEERISDLLPAVEEEVAKRPFRPVVRLEVERSMPDATRSLLLRELQFEARGRVSVLGEEDLYVTDWLVDLNALKEVASLPLPELQYPPHRRTTPLPAKRSVFETVSERDQLLQFPSNSFEATVERFLTEAAEDPEVIAIKVTLYRTSRSSRIVKVLRQARQHGKEVVALIELKASFDEQRNIEWARSLEAAGIHVVFGPPRLKVHAKIALVVRRENGAGRRYFYIGTGNLNAATAAAYTDLGILSSAPELGDELTDVFNSLTGYSRREEYRHLLVAPFNMRERFLELIGNEAENARSGRPAGIRAKLNGLTDREIITALCQASAAGVDIDLVVRGLCVLRPGVEGLSDRIRIVSVLGRFLEHSRIFRFENGGDPHYFIGSADWRPRNLSRRVEVAAPVRDAKHRMVLDRIINEDLANPDAWELQSDGRYTRRSGPGGEPMATDARMPSAAIEK